MYEEKSHVGMSQCYFCGDDFQILLETRFEYNKKTGNPELRKSLPRRVGVRDMEPCNKCKEYMKQGIILMSIKDDTTPEEMKGQAIYKSGIEVGRTPPNPHRTGGWVVIKEEAYKRMFKGEAAEFGLKHRFMFIADEAWSAVGLPRGEVEGVPTK
jgi:hypothetical protein